MMVTKAAEITFKKVMKRKIEIEQENDKWVVTDPETNVSSYGNTKKEALKAFEEALSLYYAENPPLLVNVNFDKREDNEAKTTVRA